MAIDRKTYNAYISSNAWRVRRDAYFQKHLRKCLACGSTDEIHLHHRSYDNFTKEKDGDLRALCAKCHKKLHRLQKKHGWTLASATDYVINRGLKTFAPRKKRKLRAKKKWINSYIYITIVTDHCLTVWLCQRKWPFLHTLTVVLLYL